MRYGLNSLLAVVTVAPPVLAGVWFTALWLRDKENFRSAIVFVFLAIVFVGAVTIAIWTKRVARASWAGAKSMWRTFMGFDLRELVLAMLIGALICWPIAMFIGNLGFQEMLLLLWSGGVLAVGAWFMFHKLSKV